MSCFCHKLVNRLYGNISTPELTVLRQAWLEAPRLFCDIAGDTVIQAKGKRKRSSQPRPVRSGEPTLQTNPPDSGLPTPPSPDSVAKPQSAVVLSLVNTYVADRTADAITPSLHKSHASSISAEIFRAFEQNARSQTALQRLYCIAFAEQHLSCTSVQPIVDEILRELPSARDVDSKVKRMLYLGRKWSAIHQMFAAIVKTLPDHVTGFICLLSAPSAWERAETAAQMAALVSLHKTTDIYRRAEMLTPRVNEALGDFRSKRSFIDETHKFASKSSAQRRPRISNRSNSRRSLHTLQAAHSGWHAQTIAATSLSVTGLSDVGHDDAHILLALLSFFPTTEKVPLDLLVRGATPRQRWTAQGEIEELQAIENGLCPELQTLLSDVSRVRDAFDVLQSQSVVSLLDQACLVHEQIVCRVRETLPTEYTVFWRCQALIVSYRAIPWKHIESFVRTTTSFLPHLEHSLRAFENSFDCLSPSTRVDLALTLLEASRFPTMGWKRFAIGQSELVARGLNDPYLESCIGRSQRLLARLDGKVVKAVGSPQLLDNDRPTCILDKRMHSAAGQEIIQRSLDYIQTEAMAAAKATLEQWTPVGLPSPMEDVVLVRKHVLLGRILRYMGKFDESLTSLEIARKTTERHGAAFFDEDLRDLTCELSDTLRELDDPVSAERHIRTELARRQQSYNAAPGKSSLQLSLAEALFAQTRLNEAAALCLEVQSRVKLLKFENLRLQIILAKIRHVESDYEEAFFYWNRALRAVKKYPMTNGRLTRVIVLSVRDALIQLGYGGSVHESTKAAEDLDKLAAADSVQHWIAGTRQWVSVLTVRRSHL